MRKEIVQKKKNRDGEKGAAMVMVLLLSTLLLVASAGILLETTMNTANVTDTTAEQQAYNAAESGLQSAINVLRGNVVPNPLIDSTKPATDIKNRISFRNAVTLSTSNTTGDTSTSARLSRWMPYNYSPTGNLSFDRVVLGLDNPTTYNPLTGHAYSVVVTDPDDTGKIIFFETSGGIYDPIAKAWGQSLCIDETNKTCGVSSVSRVTFTYTPYNPSNPLDVTSGSVNSNFGSFKVDVVGSVTFTDDVRFQILLEMTAPYTATRVLRGWIALKGKTINTTDSLLSKVYFDFDSPVFELMGSTIELQNLNADNALEVLINSAAPKTINIKMSQAEPYRVVVRSTGYGPRGSQKQLEATVQKNFFNGMTAPATLTLVGPHQLNGVTAVFEPGESAASNYSGQDVVTPIILPPVGTTDDANLAMVLDKMYGDSHPFNGSVTGTPADVSPEMPFWLKSTSNLHTTLEALKRVAEASGRYYTAGQIPPDLGDNANARGITFVNGNLQFSGSGGGIVVVTGKLTFNGAFNFNGLLIVTGADGLIRTGGGEGVVQGNVVVAPYYPNNLAMGFLPPKYQISGAGNQEIVFNSSSVANGMTAVSNFVLGVAEK